MKTVGSVRMGSTEMPVPFKKTTRAPRRDEVALSLALATVFLVAGSGSAQIIADNTTCVNESNGLLNNCTANDLTFVQLGLGVQQDGCVNSSDRVRMLLRGAVQNSTAQGRYDVGMWFPRPDDTTGIIDPEGDGALTGDCYLAGLMNAEPSPPTDACTFDTPPGALDLASGSGPWVNADGTGNYDACGDVFANAASTTCDGDGDGRWDDSIVLIDLLVPTNGIQITCTDVDANGFVDMPVCLSWGNNNNQVDNTGDNLCNAMSELRPGTKSKCRCEQAQPTDIPAPELTYTCSMPPGITTVAPGGTVDITITYTNTCSCTPNPVTTERFQCCTASYIQAPIDYNQSYLQFVSADPGNGTATDNGDIVTWTPGVSGGGTAGDGILAGSESDTIVITFQVLAAGDGDVTYVDAGTNWSNFSDFSSPQAQSALTSQCGFFINSTRATISPLAAAVRDGRTVVSWESSAEVGTVGYDLFRSDAKGEIWTKVNHQLLPAVGDGPGGQYQVIDHDAPTQGEITYKLREVDAWGAHRETGPSKLTLEESLDPAPAESYVAEKREPSRRLVAARDRRRMKSQATVSASRTEWNSRSSITYVKLGVRETGLYRVSASSIAAALGEPVAMVENSIEKGRLALMTGGQPVAWRTENGGRDLLFFGEAPDTVYDTERVYVVTRGRGLAMDVAPGVAPQATEANETFRDTAVFEQDLLMRPFNVSEVDQDYWFWSFVITGDPENGEKTLDFDLADVASDGSAASLGVTFVGFLPGDSLRGAVFVNNHFVGDLDGVALSRGEASFEFDHALLQDGANSVSIVAQKGGFFIDSLLIEYDHLLQTFVDELILSSSGGEAISVGGFSTPAVEAYSISDTLQPVLLPSSVTPAADGATFVLSFTPEDGGRYLVVAANAVRPPASVTGRSREKARELRSGAEYLIVTSGELAGSAERLADHRRDQGLESMVIDIEDIFDAYAFGSRDPEAIRSFLAHAVDHWMTPPRYLLLAGRGHYDYKDYLGFGGNLLPPALAATVRGLVPSDNTIADLSGDGLPDLAIGRLPVVTAEGLDRVIDKIIEHENAEDGSWSRQVVLVADDPDAAGDFFASSDALALALAGDRTAEKVYLTSPYTADEVHGLIMQALGTGAGVVNWTGHAGLDSLANERLLQISDLGHLEATDHPSVFVGLTCLMNLFTFPYFATLGEELLLEPDGGAIAVWAAAGFSDNGQAGKLGEAFMAELESDQVLRLGDTIKRAIGSFAGQAAAPNMVDVYVLLGDPAQVLR